MLSGRKFESTSVLIVDDDDFACNLLTSMLQELHVHDVAQAENGAAALELIKDGFDADIIITDWEMPVMDGIELTRTIREQFSPSKATVPIIMVTSHSRLAEVEMARDAGITEFLVKPFSPSGLSLRMQSALMKPRPFIDSASFTGPDRRRKEIPGYGAPDRRRQ